MKIGIMTFHWATNHGALLQAYALQNTLTSLFPDSKVEIINYWPEQYRKTVLRSLRSGRIRVIQRYLRDMKKEKKLTAFREALPQTHRYYSQQELMKEALDYDVLIAGSDQIWNQSYTMNGEGCKTAAYYLPFCQSAVHLSYAASFGTDKLSEETIEFITPLLRGLDAVSVRENSAKELLKHLGIEASVVCDPSVFLPAYEYRRLAKNAGQSGYVASYFLHLANRELYRQVKEVFTKQEIKDIEMSTEEEWIGAIANASFLVTNSFHGMMVALKLHTRFAVVLSTETLAGMNDRFYTILGRLGLQSRIISQENELSAICQLPIDWDKVDRELESYAEESKLFLTKHCVPRKAQECNVASQKADSGSLR